MLLSLEADTPRLSHLLHKHPDRVHTQDSSFGRVHVFYPEPQKAVLLLDIDPLKLTKRGGTSAFALQPYVNDRPYVASSFLSVALNQVFRTALAGRCERHPELVERAMGLEIRLPVLPCRGGRALLERLFLPLGYRLTARAIPLDPRFPEWGDSAYFDVTLTAHTVLYRALRHLYVLMPVLDNDKHYWIGPSEVDKLLERGRNWLSDHPERELIVSRYLKSRGDLTRHALKELAPIETVEESDDRIREQKVEQKTGLHDLRLDAVAKWLDRQDYRAVADLGCGEGRLLQRLVKLPHADRLIGMDVSTRVLEKAERQLAPLSESQRQRIELMQGSLLYDDSRLRDLDAAVLLEVIEHIEPDRLPRVAHTLFQRIRPRTVIITTPNRDYNQLWESLPPGNFRHSDHRFEWSRCEFSEWAQGVKTDYSVQLSGLGDAHPEFGSPSQMAVFQR